MNTDSQWSTGLFGHSIINCFCIFLFKAKAQNWILFVWGGSLGDGYSIISSGFYMPDKGFFGECGGGGGSKMLRPSLYSKNMN